MDLITKRSITELFPRCKSHAARLCRDFHLDPQAHQLIDAFTYEPSRNHLEAVTEWVKEFVINQGYWPTEDHEYLREELYLAFRRRLHEVDSYAVHRIDAP